MRATPVHWVLVLTLAACAGDKDTSPTDTDAADTDTDVDSDTDVDTDTDVDSDADADTDTDETGDTGDTAAVHTGDTGTTTSAAWGLVYDGPSANCEVILEVTPTAASYACPNCPFALEWSYDVAYTGSPNLVDTTGCNPNNYLDQQVVYISMQVGYIENLLNQGVPVWVWTNNYGGTNQVALVGPPAAIGMVDRYDLYANPGTWDPVTGDFQFTDPYYGLVRGYGNHL